MKKVKKYIFIIILSSVFWVPLCMGGYWGDNSNINVEHQKMLSTIEYSGNGQYRHQVETLLTIEKEPLSNEKTRYSITSNDFDISQSNNWQQYPSNNISFLIDSKTGLVSTDGSRDLTILERVNNNCINTLKESTKAKIGKTWKQSFDLSIYEYSMPKKLTFTMSAINVNTEQYGKMTTVRALSEPFVLNIINSEGKIDEVKSRIRSAYLFDSEFEEIYLSMSVFDASTDIASKNEKLRQEVATYKTDASGNAVNLEGLGKDFESFVRKVGLSSKEFKVENETTLPQWAQAEGLRAFQMSNICASVACEGALNPVTTLTMPGAQIASLQSANRIVSAQQITSVSTMLAQNVSALGGMKIAAAPAWAGYGVMTASHVTALAGATAGGLAIAENNSNGGGKARSPVTP